MQMAIDVDKRPNSMLWKGALCNEMSIFTVIALCEIMRPIKLQTVRRRFAFDIFEPEDSKIC